MAGSAPPRPRKSLGQHFLTDENILRRIVEALDPAIDDVVLEIGPGRGSLTRVLAPRVGRVIAVEKDRVLAEECGVRNAACGMKNVEMVQGDALALDWRALIPHSALRRPRFKIVGNIPYYITSPLIAKALTPPLPERVVFLVQAEVADRLVARPGSKIYGGLSVGVQAMCRVEKLFAVKAGSFWPAPSVEGAVIRLRPLSPALIDEGEVPRLRAFVTACFGRRRKQLRNVLRAVTGESVESVEAGLSTVGLAPKARPETLAPEDFVRLLRWWGCL